jgi:hypothetical protein
MFKKVTRILGVIVLTGWMGAANATLIFDFSWITPRGTVTLEVLGLVDNTAGQAATGIQITSVDGISCQALYCDLFESRLWNAPVYNLINVVAGAVIDFNVLGGMPTPWNARTFGSLRVNVIGGSGKADITLAGIQYAGGVATANFVNRVTVPEPSSVILMLLGLAGLSFARYRKQY